jgi:hypothetical protein
MNEQRDTHKHGMYFLVPITLMVKLIILMKNCVRYQLGRR